MKAPVVVTRNPGVAHDEVHRLLLLVATDCLHDLILVREADSGRVGALVFDPFSGSGTTAAKELNRAFVGAELEEEFAELAARHVRATKRGSLSREISEQFRASP